MKLKPRSAFTFELTTEEFSALVMVKEMMSDLDRMDGDGQFALEISDNDFIFGVIHDYLEALVDMANVQRG